MSGLLPQGQMPEKGKAKVGKTPAMSRANMLELMQQLPQQPMQRPQVWGVNG